MHSTAGSINSKHGGEFLQWLLHTILQIDGKSRYSEVLQYSGAFNSCWEYSDGTVMGFAISDPRPTGDGRNWKEQCWSCGQRKPPLIWYIKNPMEKTRRDFSGQS